MQSNDQPVVAVLLKPGEVAQRLGISVSKMWKLLAQGVIPPAIKIGERNTRWRESDIARFIATL